MDKEMLIENILLCCAAKGVKPTVACSASGAGKNLLQNLKRGSLPAVDKVAALAAYLGVSTSELLGDVRELPPELLQAWAQLNEEGRQRLLDYAEDLAASGRYIKNRPADLDQADVI